MSKTIIVYYSQARGNTRRIAEMIANVKGYDLSGRELILVQIHGGWPGHVLKDMADAAKGAVVEGKYQVQFDNTAIYISHRLSSCQFCDEITVFDQGQIV